jgi:CRISPR-associated protein Cas5t
MLGLYVTVPVACFRKGMAREYLETEPLPPPATCYGFLLSLVGETDRRRHLGCRIAPVRLQAPHVSVVLRTCWRIKNRKQLPGNQNNRRPDYQQLLSGNRLVIWLDSSQEGNPPPSLEERVRQTLENPAQVERFGGLSLGESTHLVDEVRFFQPDGSQRGEAFLLDEAGRMTMPVWVDHVGSQHTRYACGNLEETPLTPPELDRMPLIQAPPAGTEDLEPGRKRGRRKPKGAS